jgi:hypothetical protein
MTGLAMTTFVYFHVPETKGSRLEDMDEIFGVPKVDEGKKILMFRYIFAW